ncbi:hypothetical protein AAT19DRAFT_10803 [Rhodotorula toruloides]|uniref:Uncharacterized protein n=1 Tax=Rhodotorula toruloides TaxID=5286 RepID=A0A2S9ZY09_RHOTO|nr:hypothetical protein AAT19DRAFT_10803 [Rhodotorula toruloides]
MGTLGLRQGWLASLALASPHTCPPRCPRRSFLPFLFSLLVGLSLLAWQRRSRPAQRRAQIGDERGDKDETVNPRTALLPRSRQPWTHLFLLRVASVPTPGHGEAGRERSEQEVNREGQQFRARLLRIATSYEPARGAPGRFGRHRKRDGRVEDEERGTRTGEEKERGSLTAER